MGEASKQVSQAFRKAHREIPWKEISGMRDKLIHDYLGVDADAVWDTVANDLPKLKRQMIAILRPP
ncbi:DUF86 domain-containing protein [Candidatus Micrarchaeota archaeon]|nr:DUF86 domain-containing protein [Candidatus Micrarchaeota archaeon]